ncbi:MAG: hypothetical protein HZB16_04990 [Armatimonadetes bacterium]|nr:hypothetical protein [Armatimonadota bacterium]
MPRRPKRQWHAQNDSPGCARFGVGCGALFSMQVVVFLLIALAGTGTGASWLMPVLVAAMVAAYLAVPSLIRGAARAGITTDDEGVTEWYPLFFRRRVRWADLTMVEASDFRAVLAHPRGRVVLEPPLADWAQLAGRAQRQMGCEPTIELHEDDVLTLPPDEVAAWLGIARDGELSCVSRFHRRWVWWLVAPLLVIGLMFASSLFFIAFVGLYASGLAAVTGRRRDRRVHEIRASANSLDVRSDAGWRTLSWGGIKDLTKTGLFWVVHTVDGDVWLPPRLSNVDPLLHAIRGAIEARRQGWALPRAVGDVPESALSRAELRVETERGLSVTGWTGEEQGDG